MISARSHRRAIFSRTYLLSFYGVLKTKKRLLVADLVGQLKVYSKVRSKKFRTVRPKLSLNWASLNTIKIKQGYAQSGDLEEGSLTFTFSEDSGN